MGRLIQGRPNVWAVPVFSHGGAAADVTAPGTPAGLTSTPGDTQIVYDWNDNAEPDLDHYEYRYGPDGGAFGAWTEVAVSTVTVTGLTNGQAYDFEVRAVDTSDNASAAATDTETPTSGAFDPVADITWHMVFYADDIVASDGAALATWEDSSPNNRDATQATGASQPTYRLAKAELNSQPAVEFDGTADHLDTATFTELAQPNTIVIVARLNTASAVNPVVAGASGTKRHNVSTSGGAWVINAGAGQTGGTTDTVAHLLIATFDTTDTLEIDGVQVISADAGAEGTTGMRIGASAAGTAFFAGSVSFVGLHDSTLTAQEKSDLLTWAQTKYAV